MATDLVLELPNDLGAIASAVAYVIERCEECDTDSRKVRLNFRVGLTEALSNAMLYGNGRDPSKRVRVEVTVDRGTIVARITDEGPGFDPEVVPDPTVPANREKPGGRGLFLMRKFMDELHFNEEGNSVTMVCRCGGRPFGSTGGPALA